ncbi:MAG: 23S rRNA methyltransferase [Gammaproteobacteria bacterium]|nr:23S rRNA methyltransferase [Gammaproteobacteria bacterium]
MAKQDKKWLQRQEKDPYVKQARESSYRSRAVYKLSEIDKRDQLIRKANTVVDIGASPGSWSQYASEKLHSQGRIIAVDLLTMEPIKKVEFIQGDFTEPSIVKACLEALGEEKADLVMSDIAPNLSGVRNTDQARIINMAELVLDFTTDVLIEGGDLLIKLFQGEGMEQYQKELKQLFQKVMVRKPKASRSESRELYVLARGYKV